jgi:Ice-binding-like
MQKKSTQKQQARISAATRAATLTILALLAVSQPAAAAEVIPLGEAAQVAILGGSTVTNAGPTMVVGNLALSPGVSVTGFPPGTISGGSIHINDALATQAHADAFTAYTQVAGETLTTDLSGMNLGGMLLTPGVYHFDTTAQLTGALMLDTGGDPDAAFHFQIGTTLATDPLSTITLLNGDSVNIFWQVGTSATIGSDSMFIGNLIADQSISVELGAMVDGRLLAINAAVTLNTNTINGFADVPEPSPWAMIMIGAGLLFVVQRRYHRKTS